MNYEEKYKEALERARDLHKDAIDMGESLRAKQCEIIFPELRESEDERIRKELIEFVKRWKEKGKGFCPKVPLWTSDVEECNRYIAWLEKQGGKPQGKSSLEAINEVEGGNRYGVNDTPYNYEHATIAQKDFVPKVEPKFKVGDWVAYNHNPNLPPKKIIQITNNHYIFADCSFGAKTLEIDFHLWTIQDAKDGDVLVNGSNIFIFHFINDTRLMGYCHINTDDGRFYDDLGKNECFCLIDAVVTPATKEQRDLLSQKMKEAGYEWDADKKELMKISQRMISAEAKEALYDKPAWSEEDEKILEDIEEAIIYYWHGDTQDNLLDWLKSIKELIMWKPSDEQMKALQMAGNSYRPSEEEHKILFSLYYDLKKLIK